MITDTSKYFDSSQIPLVFDNSTPAMINGTPIQGYMSVFAEVQGLDLIVSLAIVQTILLGFLMYFAMRRSYSGREGVK